MISTLRYGLLLLFLSVGNQADVFAQDPSLAPADLQFTRNIVENYHFVAWATLEMGRNQFTRYQYDHYPAHPPETAVERIKADEGVFVRHKGEGWLKSDDWGRTGAPIGYDLEQKLDLYVSVVDAQFIEPTHRDTAQGGTVWKFIGQSKDQTFTHFTYEESRETPRPNGVYPRYTFMKAANDTDGRLFLCKTAGVLRSGDRRIPCTIRLDYLIPLPPNTKVEVFDHVTGKKKAQLVTGKDSGWEVTSPQSAPPPGP